MNIFLYYFAFEKQIDHIIYMQRYHNNSDYNAIFIIDLKIHLSVCQNVNNPRSRSCYPE